ncbi:NAD-dependent epimerase/dehydratase family protein [Roseivivax sediminis]|uniref:Nucleoside-diphosphate-sugar epimerase n=1 Tax=Roseivivax sediminis TaxID=936889 RepID=A0A1I1UVA6_9RHOB|nr:NAD-dependent epimerase/dehydratase family protein [Roseivivax sediminis]SFD71950.1 Nucleoside-diphosphate-sugar epimerase [Roseivivax sediminis]
MGALGRIAVTGAGGFLGRAVLAEARARGIAATALARRADELDADVVACDLADSGPELADALRGADAVIHAAAHMGGDTEVHARDTLRATERLLRAMTDAGVARLVLVGSAAVYDVAALPPGSAVDEDTPVATEAAAADTYARAKIAQEALVRDWAAAPGRSAHILRAGAVYGPGRLWNAHLGVRAGPVLLRLGRGGTLPLVHRDRAARALLDAAGTAGDGVTVLNLLDDDLPDRGRYLAALRRTGWPTAVAPLPWPLLLPAAKALAGWPGRPGLLRERALRARMAPYHWSNARLRAAFPERDRGTFEERFG